MTGDACGTSRHTPERNATEGIRLIVVAGDSPQGSALLEAVSRLDGGPLQMMRAASVADALGKLAGFPDAAILVADADELRRLAGHAREPSAPAGALREAFEGALVRRDRGAIALVLVAADVAGPADASVARAEMHERLLAATREGDKVAALDTEVAVLMEELPHARIAGPVAERLLQRLSRPPSSQGAPFTISIGAAVLAAEESGLDALLARARRALFAARAAGGNQCRVEAAEATLEEGTDASTSDKLARLTPRERQVLDMLVDGKSSKMIAYLLGTSTRTIEAHRTRVMEKMKARSLASLVRMVVQRDA